MTTSICDRPLGPGRTALRSLAALVVAVGGMVGCVTPPDDTTVAAGGEPGPDRVDPRSYTVRIRATTCDGVGVGTGFLLDAETIITNRHVVEEANKLVVETYLGDELTVDVASQGGLADLAIVKIEQGATGDTARLAPGNPARDDRLRVFGYPRGGPLSVARGRVEKYLSDPRLGNLGKVMRADLDIQPGNSGGPALDDEDRVVGVVYAIERSTKKALIVPVTTLTSLLERDDLEPVEPC